MKTFAIIENGVVINCIVAENQATAESFYPEKTCIEYFDVEVNDTYVNGQFVKQTKSPVELSWAMSGN